jgi:hypothetical protein
VLAILQDQKWWIAAQGTGLKYLVFLPISGAATLYAWDTNNLYQLFNSSTGAISSRVMTKLWDGGDQIQDKKGIRGIVGVTYTGGGQTITGTTDNENGSQTLTVAGTTSTVTWLNATSGVVQWQNALSQNVNFVVTGYVLSVGPSTTGGGKYLGLTFTSSSNGINYNLFGIEFTTGARWK